MRSKFFPRAICILIAVWFFVYFYFMDSPPDLFDRVVVERYDLTDTNSFRTISYYTKSLHVRSKTDVTLITQVSVDRLFRIKNMADSWAGPISASVYVKNETLLKNIDDLYSGSASVQKYVDFHILFANRTRYPVNNLRNLALKNARTSLILILDADFVASEGMHDYLSEVGRQDMFDNANRKRAYVIPAFSSDLRAYDLPKTKLDLITALKDKTVAQVNTWECPKCHGPTDYTRWYQTDYAYEAKYKWIYEPYLMLNKDYLTELFDERLKGYGFDKNSHVFTLATAGYHFFILPSPFVIHLNHAVAEWDGPSIQEQLWEALKIVCDILPRAKIKYNFDPNISLFDEPVGDEACFSRDHW